MAATVLLDHADDWQEDLAAGQFNAHVAWLSGLPQHAENVDRNRRQVLSALMQGDGDDHHSYFDLIDQHLQRAQQFAGQGRFSRIVRLYRGVSSTARESTGRRSNWRQRANIIRTHWPAWWAGFCHRLT